MENGAKGVKRSEQQAVGAQQMASEQQVARMQQVAGEQQAAGAQQAAGMRQVAGEQQVTGTQQVTDKGQDSLTELVFLVDRSGSMAGMELDTIGGVNAVLERNAQEGGDVVVSVVLFDHETEVLVDRRTIETVSPLTQQDYWVRGCTALLDALGGSIKFIDRVHRYLRAADKPGKTIFVITTDGMENASQKFTYSQVKSMIDAKQDEGWEFLFLGANIDAVAEAQRLGIPDSRAATYLNDSAGAGVMYKAVAEATCCMRACGGEGEPPMDASWKASIERDARLRG